MQIQDTIPYNSCLISLSSDIGKVLRLLNVIQDYPMHNIINSDGIQHNTFIHVLAKAIY